MYTVKIWSLLYLPGRPSFLSQGTDAGKSNKRHILYLSMYCCVLGAIKGRKETLCYFSRQYAMFFLSLSFAQKQHFEAAVLALLGWWWNRFKKFEGVFSKSQLVRGHVCTVSKLCLAPRSVQLYSQQLLRKGFKKPTVHSRSLRQCRSRFSSILSGVYASLWKSAYSGIDPFFKFSETIFWVLYVFYH